jgi:hypothetical protein
MVKQGAGLFSVFYFALATTLTLRTLARACAIKTLAAVARALAFGTLAASAAYMALDMMFIHEEQVSTSRPLQVCIADSHNR